ncbi:hypothetical protein MRX96_032234 [Rhipicephalus microplus]
MSDAVKAAFCPRSFPRSGEGKSSRTWTVQQKAAHLCIPATAPRKARPEGAVFSTKPERTWHPPLPERDKHPSPNGSSTFPFLTSATAKHGGVVTASLNVPSNLSPGNSKSAGETTVPPQTVPPLLLAPTTRCALGRFAFASSL